MAKKTVPKKAHAKTRVKNKKQHSAKKKAHRVKKIKTSKKTPHVHHHHKVWHARWPKRHLIEARMSIPAPVVEKPTLTTEYDTLLALVKQRKVVSIRDAALVLKIPRKDIEKYALVLAENDLVVLEYPAFGGIKIRDSATVLKKGAKSENNG